jgi:two-component sensor histidine kinase
VRNDELIASDALQRKVRRVVRDDFTQYLNQQWAVYIHGKILTRMASTSLKLQSSSSASDSRTYSATLESLHSLLSNPDADFEAVSADLEAEVTSRLAPWRGLLEINVHIDEELKSLRNARVKNIGEVIEELVSNSIRHGKAKKIDLRVTRSEGSDIEIIAIDNAIIPPANPPLKFGLGTRIFNLVSDGRWSITRVGLFTEFKLMVALE